MEGWNSVEDRLPQVKCGKFRVRRTQNDAEENAIFYQDKRDPTGWLEFFDIESGHWWDAYSDKMLEDVTHWREL